MRFRRHTKVLSDPPGILAADIAFNLLIFFVCVASTAPEDGRKQTIPRSESKAEPSKTDASNVEVALTRSTVSVAGNPVPLGEVRAKIETLLKGKSRPEERVVVVKSAKDTPYQHWIKVTGLIEEAGGVITLQLEESREVPVQ